VTKNTPAFVSIRVHSWFKSPLHSYPFVPIRSSKHPCIRGHSCPFVVQIAPAFVSVRVHSWFKPPLHPWPFVVQKTPAFVFIRGHSWFKPPLHSRPFVSIRGSKHPCIRGHSCPFVVQTTPASVAIRGHSWFKTPPAFLPIRGSNRPLQLSESPDTRTQSQTNPHNARACGNLYCEHH
jgi:hypothetical protein